MAPNFPLLGGNSQEGVWGWPGERLWWGESSGSALLWTSGRQRPLPFCLSPDLRLQGAKRNPVSSPESSSLTRAAGHIGACLRGVSQKPGKTEAAPLGLRDLGDRAFPSLTPPSVMGPAPYTSPSPLTNITSHVTDADVRNTGKSLLLSTL